MHYFKPLLTCLFLLVSTLFGSDTQPVVLVTGGAGYIGSHVCKALSEAGYLPVTYDSLALGSKEAVKWGPLVVGDLLDKEVLDEAFRQYKPIAVLHLAGLRDIAESLADPSRYYTNNVAGSINLLNALVKHQVPYIVFSSSCTVYGDYSCSPISEEQAKTPINPYAKSKYIVETILKDYALAYSLHYMIVRYFNVAGVDGAAGLKRAMLARNFLIPRTMLALLNRGEALKIFGSDYPTRDGTCIRDYIHVTDLARAHLLSLEHLQAGHPSNEVNLGTGRGYSVLEIVHKIEEVTGKEVPYEIKPRRAGEMGEAIAAVQKAKELLGFETTCSDLDTIITSEWNAIQD